MFVACFLLLGKLHTRAQAEHSTLLVPPLLTAWGLLLPDSLRKSNNGPCRALGSYI